MHSVRVAEQPALQANLFKFVHHPRLARETPWPVEHENSANTSGHGSGSAARSSRSRGAHWIMPTKRKTKTSKRARCMFSCVALLSFVETLFWMTSSTGLMDLYILRQKVPHEGGGGTIFPITIPIIIPAQFRNVPAPGTPHDTSVMRAVYFHTDRK